MWFAVYFTGLIGSLAAGVYFSVTARQRGIHPLESRMILGKMNVALGCLLLLLGINQFTFPSLTTVRVVVALVFLSLGGVNLTMGMRNYLRYRREWQQVVRQEGGSN